MNVALIHRGPDDEGVFDGGSIAVAMRRLAIIDLSGGHQPIGNEDGMLQIVMNGEIYNYRELRSELVRRGHQFKTESDTEVVLHLFEEYGENIPKYLKGMFAFCIFDRRENSLFVARDRFGEKPLFYWADADTFAFSSELHSLLQCPFIPRRLNRAALPYYLQYGYAPWPMTMFESIEQLPPGHWMRWREGRLEQGRYFRVEFQPDESLDEVSAAEQVRQALLNAVARQRVSDVPVGAFLSGGIDSSTIVAALQRQSARPVPTFTAKFENAAYDESPIARRVAQHLGTDHHEFVIPNRGFCDEDLQRIVKHVGQPFGDSSAIPTYYISRQIRDHVTVCLSGDGGDEMFAGYDFFVDCMRVDRLARLAPRIVLETVGHAASGLSSWRPFKKQTRLRILRQACDVGAMSPESRFRRMAPIFDETEIGGLISAEARRSNAGQNGAALDRFSSSRYPTRLRQLMDFRIGHSLSEDMLVKVDRMSMATSLEVRAPMLDVEVYETAARLPDRLLIRGKTTKYLLREAARPWLPEEVFTHPKWGFAIPLHDYQNAQYERLARDLLLGGGCELAGHVFDSGECDRLVRRGLTRKQDAADVSVFRATHQLWSLVQFAAWANMFDVSL